MFFAASANDTTLYVAIITTMGLIVVAGIGVVTARITSGARKDVQIKADEASKSAEVAKDFAAALGAKDALILSLDKRLQFVEEHDEKCTKRVEDLEARFDEGEEQRRAASAIERDQRDEIDQLRKEIDALNREK